MRQILSKSDGVMGAGQYLHGSYHFPSAATLVHAQLQVQPPLEGVITLGLEINDVVTEVFSVGQDEQVEVAVYRLLNLALAAESVVRWKVVEFTAPFEQGPLKTSVTLGYESGGFPSTLAPAPVLTVQWVDGQERLTLFDYDPATAEFTVFTAPSFAAARAVIDTHGRNRVSIAIEGETVLSIVSGTLSVAAIHALGGVATSEEPRLEFMVNGARIATLSKEGTLRVACVEQDDAPQPAASGFTFYSLAGVSAVLTDAKMVVNGVQIL